MWNTIASFSRICSLPERRRRVNSDPFRLMNYNAKMTNPDIPVVYATPLPMNPQFGATNGNTPPKQSLAHNGSTRVFLPHEQQPHRALTESELRALRDQGYTDGLCQALARNNAIHVLRIWIVDNSGSMNSNDGHRLVETKQANDVKVVGCTRWTELQECVNYHVQLAALLEAPTVFRMLNDPGRVNGPQQFSIAERGPQMIGQDVSIALQTMRNSRPEGCTPLSRHIREIRDNVISMEASLRQNGTRVVIVIATDGMPTDDRGYGGQAAQQEFIQALRSMEGLPVWMVVRLCTDEDHVVEFYNELDSQLELSLDVLDDFMGEAAEIYKLNGWLNYALPLHRMREMGIYNRLFDLLDERLLTADELREFMVLLFGVANFDGVPDPQADWDGFVHAINRIQQNERNPWNPITKRLSPWIDVVKLNQAYSSSESSGCVIS
jgi:Mg-chelatase subunit ChlD